MQEKTLIYVHFYLQMCTFTQKNENVPVLQKHILLPSSFGQVSIPNIVFPYDFILVKKKTKL